jgi:probable HAF family extracellular repeat protein
MTALPTLGGNNGAVGGINDRGQVTGVAETAVRDPSCAPPQVLDFEAVVWGPEPGEIHELPPFPGDKVGAALSVVNDRGELVGGSGRCGFPTFAIMAHALLWRNGLPIDLGNLGGVMNNVALQINNRGQIIGQSDLAGDTTTHAFFWESGKMKDLGTLPGDLSSMANDINDKGQVVGVSCDANFNCRAFLWESGVMTDMNTLIRHGSPLRLTYGAGINDKGEITGSAFEQSSGYSPAFLAIPCDEEHADVEGCSDQADAAPVPPETAAHPLSLPAYVREELKRRRGLAP